MFVQVSLVLLVTALAAHVSAIDKGRLRFKVSANGLPDKDTFGTIDPYFELFFTEFGGRSETKIARSDTITNNQNPEWGTVFEFDFDRSKSQKWHFKVWDHDNGREDDKGGSTWIDVTDYVDKGELVNANLDKKGYLTVRAANPQPATAVRSAAPGQLPLPQGSPDTLQLRFKLSANGLSSKDDVGFIQGTSDPYVEIFAAEGVTGKLRKIGRSGTLTGTNNPSWGEVFEYPFDRRKDQRLQFKIWDHDNLREDDKAGLTWVELNDYVSHGQVLTLNLNKKGTLTITRADGLPPNPYNPNQNSFGPTQSPQQFSSQQPLPQAGFVQPSSGPLTKGTVPIVSPPAQINAFNKPQVLPPQVAAPAPVPATVTPQLTILRFKVSARNLEDKDFLPGAGTSDPYVKVYVTQDGRAEELIKTSAKLSDNENPEWPDIFELKYDPSKNPRLRFLVLDEDDGRRDDELGNVTVEAAEILQKNFVSSSLSKGTLSITRV